MVATFDRKIGPIKKRVHGATAGELLVGLAQFQLLGGDALVALDRQRCDVAVTELSATPPILATTAGSLARRFGAEQLAGVELANAEVIARAVGLLPQARKTKLQTTLTIDMDSTDVEVYGSRKQGVAYNYAGQRAGRPHLATWAEAGLSVAADPLAGNDDVRPRAAAMLRRALAAVPTTVRAALAGTGQVPRARSMLATSPATLPWPRAVTSRSLRNATPRCGGPTPRSTPMRGSRPRACPARRSLRSTTPPRAGQMTPT